MSPSNPESSSLLTHFETIEDPQTAYLVEHPLLAIVALTICGAKTWEEIEEYGQSKHDWLKTFLELPNGIPSHDTISRVFALIEPSQLHLKSLHVLTAVEISSRHMFQRRRLFSFCYRLPMHIYPCDDSYIALSQKVQSETFTRLNRSE